MVDGAVENLLEAFALTEILFGRRDLKRKKIVVTLRKVDCTLVFL